MTDLLVLRTGGVWRNQVEWRDEWKVGTWDVRPVCCSQKQPSAIELITGSLDVSVIVLGLTFFTSAFLLLCTTNEKLCPSG